MDYCLAYADRAQQHGFEALVVLGGDKNVGPPRCVEHAWQLREEIRPARAGPGARRLGESARRSQPQVGHLLDARVNAEFYLTQIVSHHSRGRSRRFLAEAERRGLTMPGMFGVFYYRSANPRTLAALSSFLPVPVEELTREFGEGATADEVCARSIRALTDAGVRHFYISNLPLGRAAATLQSRSLDFDRRSRVRSDAVPIQRLGSRVESADLLARSLELIFFVGKEDVEAGQRSVAAADVRLQLHLDVFRQIRRVDLLLERAQPVPQHHDLVKERFDRPALLLKCRCRAAAPAFRRAIFPRARPA